MKKIGILYICTGKYSVFWERFYENSQKFFFTEKNIEKHYFVFTDDFKITPSDNINIYKKDSEGFPLDSLKRFELFLSIEKDLIDMDYLFFLNANMDFVQKVGEEILPSREHSGLVGVLHPGYYNSKKEKLPYERDKRSKAYIPYKKDYHYKYFMGGFNGGKTEDFLRLCKICNENIIKDQKKNIMACFHDESHINSYFFNKNILVLSSEYGYPEDTIHSFQPKVIILNKAKHYGDSFIKEYANPFIHPSPFEKKQILRKIISKIKNLLTK